MLRRWNAAFNLVGRGDIHRLVPRHFLDALPLLGVVRGPRLLDIGSGAGLPGLVIAIVAPQLAVTLLERTARRARFLEFVAADLALPNVQVVNADAEHWRDATTFDTITARAVASGEVLARLVRPHLAPNGVLVAQFGSRQDEQHLPPGFRVLSTHEYTLPESAARFRLFVLGSIDEDR